MIIVLLIVLLIPKKENHVIRLFLKFKVMSTFQIDFFELAFLAEACIPPVPIARASFFADLSDKYYALMTQEERNRLFEWLSPRLDLTNEDCQHFFARFNMFNQYRVRHTYNGRTDETIAYKFNGKYHVSKNKSINEDYIDCVFPLHGA